MRVLVCGGRDFDDRDLMTRTLAPLEKTTEIIIHGAARGADTMAEEWAQTVGVPSMAFPAEWDKHGRAAGPIRNKQMLETGKPDLVVAFPGGRGTANMVKQAKAAGVDVIEVESGPTSTA